MMKINFNVDMKKLGDAKEKMKRVTQKALWKSMNKMKEIAVKKCPVNTGALRNSIDLSPKFEGAEEYKLQDGVSYGVNVEYGSSPHYAPIKPLKEWSRRVLGDEGAAYAVQKKIAKKGTDAHPFFRPAYKQVKDIYFPRYTKQLMQSRV